MRYKMFSWPSPRLAIALLASSSFLSQRALLSKQEPSQGHKKAIPKQAGRPADLLLRRASFELQTREELSLVQRRNQQDNKEQEQKEEQEENGEQEKEELKEQEEQEQEEELEYNEKEQQGQKEQEQQDYDEKEQQGQKEQEYVAGVGVGIPGAEGVGVGIPGAEGVGEGENPK